MTITYRVPTANEYYGDTVTDDVANHCAQVQRRHIEDFVAKNFPDVDVDVQLIEHVHRHPWVADDPEYDILLAIETFVEQNWVDWLEECETGDES